MTFPRDRHGIVLAGIFILLTFYTLYFLRAIAIPICIAFVLNLLLQPAMLQLARLHLPRAVAAILVIALFFGVVGGVAVAVSLPAADWMARAPETFQHLEDRLAIVKEALQRLQAATARVEHLTETGTSGFTVSLSDAWLSGFLFTSTASALSGIGLTVILLFFLLVAGDLFLRRLVEIVPNFSDKKQIVLISQEIESNISGYLLTITLINAAVGLCTGIAAYAFGLADPLLWGVTAFLLNYIPILGPLVGVGVLLLVGLVSFDDVWRALGPAATYLVIHIVEGENVTPMLLARRFTLNPVLVIISIVFWYWMWGVPGALLAVPMLATTKIVCDRVESLQALGHFLGSESNGWARTKPDSLT